MENFGVVAGIAALPYMAISGQKSLQERWWRERNYRTYLDPLPSGKTIVFK